MGRGVGPTGGHLAPRRHPGHGAGGRVAAIPPGDGPRRRAAPARSPGRGAAQSAVRGGEWGLFRRAGAGAGPGSGIAGQQPPRDPDRLRRHRQDADRHRSRAWAGTGLPGWRLAGRSRPGHGAGRRARRDRRRPRRAGGVGPVRGGGRDRVSDRPNRAAGARQPGAGAGGGGVRHGAPRGLPGAAGPRHQPRPPPDRDRMGVPDSAVGSAGSQAAATRRDVRREPGGAPLRGAGGGDAAGVCAHDRERARRGGDLRPVGRPAARDRTGRRPGPPAAARRAPGPARQPPRPADLRAQRRPPLPPPPHPPRHRGLELRPPLPAGASPLPPPRRLRGRRDGERPGGREPGGRGVG